MQYVQLPPSMNEWEIRKLLHEKGYKTIISISQNEEGSQIIQAY